MTGYIHDESFELPLQYGGKELMLPARMVQMGYTYKIFVKVGDQEIIFEPDEERNFRGIIENAGAVLDAGLITAIGRELEKNFR